MVRTDTGTGWGCVMKRMNAFIKRNFRYAALSAILLILALASLRIYRYLHSPPPGQWLRDMYDSHDEDFKKAGLVKVGKHTWEGPRDGQTNSPSTTNKVPGTLRD